MEVAVAGSDWGTTFVQMKIEVQDNREVQVNFLAPKIYL